MRSGPLARLVRALPVLGRMAGPPEAEVGSLPTWSFRHAVLGGDAIRSLGDLRGRAALVQFIGLH